MIRRNKMKGFTLVELLAVIVILAIILVIAVPKVMSVIEDSKKATLESTAKMIASSAEKAKVQNAVLGKENIITCDSVVKLNSLDYESCIVEFDGDAAKVTIKGKGKFAGLWVCEGTKNNASSQDEICGGIQFIEVPTLAETLIYNGDEQSPTWNNYNESELIISGTTSETNAGIYITTFTPKEGYAWNDGTTVSKDIEWSISKIEGTLSLNESSGTIYGVGKDITFTVNRNGDGEITAVSSDTEIVTTSVSGNTVTITSVASGSATITVSVASDTNHSAPSDVTYSVNVITTMYLYNSGNEYSDVTGGISGWLYSANNGFYNGMGSLSKGSSSISMTVVIAQSIAVGPKNKIDLTNYSKLAVNVNSYNSWYEDCGIVVSNTRESSVLNSWVKKSSISSAGVTQLDVSSLTGEYYVFVYQYQISNATNNFSFNQLYLEA